jgi:threonylcarbamoyladenosine tRNA methylthiotransferase MtaB
MINKKFKLISFGCRLNQSEIRMIGEKLVKAGFVPCNTVSSADVVLINSCSITKKAEKELRNKIREIKKNNPEVYLAVTGCWATKMTSKHFQDNLLPWDKNVLKNIDLLVDNKDKEMLVEQLKKQFSDCSYSSQAYFRDKYAQSQKALIKIQDGCNNFCSYCIVPYLRGRSESRPAEEISAEVEEKTDQGIEEFILTGVETDQYQFNLKKTTPDLTAEIQKISSALGRLIILLLKETDLKKISFGSVSLDTFTKDFVKIFADKKYKQRLTAHFHIPLQSGCKATLFRMNRNYTPEKYLTKITMIDNIIPEFTLSTDFIVGFPGETEEEFKESFSFLKKLKARLGKRFKKAHTFRYSPREGTIASKMMQAKKWQKVNSKIKKQRSEAVRRLINS